VTVHVTLPDGETDEYMRFGDSYVKHTDGTLDVLGSARRRRSATRLGTGPMWKAMRRHRRSVGSSGDYGSMPRRLRGGQAVSGLPRGNVIRRIAR
jgi:hypothetical protein